MSRYLEMTPERWHDRPVGEDLAKITAAIGDPFRVRILDLLAEGRGARCCSPADPEVPGWLCACDLAPALGGVAVSRLAYHLAQLRAAGLVDEQKRGKWVYYTVNETALAALADAIARRWSRPPPRRRRPPTRRGRNR